MLHIYASLAEKERRLISERTKAGLAAIVKPERHDQSAIVFRPAARRGWASMETTMEFDLSKIPPAQREAIEEQVESYRQLLLRAAISRIEEEAKQWQAKLNCP
jgi:DNA invertase Pin-like site-specific DNA recombinase